MQDNNKLISVIIPAYNVQNFIVDAVASIQNQTYKNLEIIIVDDCSSDDTYNKVEKLAKNDIRIRLYRNERNLKISKTLNYALSLANGEYIVRMDGDDISMPDKIEKQLEYLEKNPHVDLVGCHVIGIDEFGNELHSTKTATDWNNIKKVISYVSPVFHIWMCKKIVYDRLDGYRELSGSEDYDFLLRMYTNNMIFVNLDDYLYKVRLRTGNTQTTAGLRQIKIAKYALKLMNERLKNNGKDSYDENIFEQFLKTSKPIAFLHSLSIGLTYRAIKCKSNKSYLCMLFACLLSVLLSPYQARLLFERFIYRITLNKEEIKNDTI